MNSHSLPARFVFRSAIGGVLVFSIFFFCVAAQGQVVGATLSGTVTQSVGSKVPFGE